MTPERWQRIKSLFERVLDHPPSKDDHVLEEPDESPSVIAEVRELIACDALAGSFLEDGGSAECSAAPALSPGDSVSGHFRIVKLLGRGGMGAVYRADDLVLQRPVALKFLLGGLSGTTQALERMKREARAASALNHPNIITIHEIGEQDGRTFIVMELVDGKALNDLIPRKGMRLTEALRIAAQVAGALAAAHAAGIVHRDLKPANIMVDMHGRVRVLDFGLAKLAAPTAAVAAGADEATRTQVLEQPVTEKGVIVGSVPYMSPEQVEGKPVDTRSDIFSFGAVLYEMITGQRAFSGASRASTLSAIVEKDPPPLSEISSTSVPELERLIARCLRKDVNRRSQNMADVKLALEELRDESESGKLARPDEAAQARGRRWLWPAVAIAVVLVAAAFTWTYFNLPGTQWKGPEMVRVSRDDGHSYGSPAISPDGGFVAYVSDRSSKEELWLQQVGGGDPIQLTHSTERVSEPVFFPDGKRILYVSTSTDNQKSALEVISTLGGDPRVLVRGGRMTDEDPKVSPDGRQVAYFEYYQGTRTPTDPASGRRLMTISSDGGQPRELPAWARMPGTLWSGRAAWTSDSRYVLCVVTKNSAATNIEGLEWFALPVDGGNPVATGAGAALRAAGITVAAPFLMTGDRLLFAAGSGRRLNAWEIRLSPGSWRVRGVPRQLTFGTQIEAPHSVSADGTVALEVGNQSNDFYLVPLSSSTGQPIGAVRRLTHDGRDKSLLYLRGATGSAYFSARDHPRSVYGVDLESGKQTLVTTWPTLAANLVFSFDGRQVAYSIPEGDSYSIRVGDASADPQEARVLCKTCGMVRGFSPDGRFLFYQPEVKVKGEPKGKLTVRLLEVASGKDKPWLEHPTDSVLVAALGHDSGWLELRLTPPGSQSPAGSYLVRWTEEPVPQSKWVRIPWDDGPGIARSRVAPSGNFFCLFQGSKLMAVRFNPQMATFSEPQEVKLAPGGAVTPELSDVWTLRDQGLVFSREEEIMSVWLMKLPR
jgi:serine/threonine protein kinase